MPANSDRALRILHVVGGMNRAGTETWLMHVLRNIDRERFRMDFLVHTDERNDYDDEIEALGSRILRLPNHRSPISYARGLVVLNRRHGPYDVVHSHVNHFSSLVLMVAKAMGVRTRIAHSHNDTSAVQATAPTHRKVYYWVTRSLINSTMTHGLAASTVAGKALFGSSWMSSKKYQTLYCGIDLSPFSEENDGRGLKEELGIPNNAFVVGHVGSFTKQKNHPFLLEIIRGLIADREDVHIVLIGEGPFRVDFQDDIDELNLSSRVHVLGVRSDVPALMKSVMDVFVLPSLHEGLPLVGMEAQAAGLRCFVSDRVTPEMVIVPHLVSYLPIDNSSDWVAEILGYRQERGAPDKRREALSYVADSPFNIERGIRLLEALYDV